MEEAKELSEGQLHPESGVLLRLGTQDCQNSVPAHRQCRRHSIDSSGKLLCRPRGRENEVALPGLRELQPRANHCVSCFIVDTYYQTYSSIETVI